MLTLEQYQQAEKDAALVDARRGFTIHAVVTVLVSIAVVLINITVASEFPWAVFPVVGMSIGLFFHWYFGVRRGPEEMKRHQETVERRAAA